jgi:DNA-binding beta-propeller fold protein YncE
MDRRDFLAAAAAPLVLGLAPAALARRAGGTPLALVTADLESSIVVLHLPTGRVLRRLHTAAGPRSIESVAGGDALVAHTELGRMSVVDWRTLEVSAVAGAFAEPRYTAIRPDGRLAYVSDSARQELIVVDVRRRRIVARTAVGGPARHLSLDRSGRRLWVSLGTKAPTVAILDVSVPARPRVVGRLRPPFLAHDVGFTPGGGRVWVTSGDRGRIAIYEARTAKLVRTLNADAPPQHVTFLDDRAFVTSGDDAILRIHALDGRLLRSAPVPAGSYNVQQGWGLILTPSLSQGTLCTFSARGAPIERLRVARSSHDACVVMST